MSENRRVSMNTSLKNARIFDDELFGEDPWDSETPIDKVRKFKSEPVQNFSDDAQFNDLQTKTVEKRVKLEFNSDNIKREKDDDECSNNADSLNFRIDSDSLDVATSVKKEYEETTNDSSDSVSNCAVRKSLKRTVFKRDSPYSKKQKESESTSAFDRLGPKPKVSCRLKKPEVEYETDPEVLSRRQKQIDFGKNTIGYDNYSKKGPRNKTPGPDDPIVPNKYIKYSRRAWDGLIKQWRLRLHKYD